MSRATARMSRATALHAAGQGLICQQQPAHPRMTVVLRPLLRRRDGADTTALPASPACDQKGFSLQCWAVRPPARKGAASRRGIEACRSVGQPTCSANRLGCQAGQAGVKSSLHGGWRAEGAPPGKVNEMRRRFSSCFLSVGILFCISLKCLIVQLRAQPRPARHECSGGHTGSWLRA